MSYEPPRRGVGERWRCRLARASGKSIYPEHWIILAILLMVTVRAGFILLA